MVARCVNPECNTQLHSFADGRMFQFEVISISVSANDDSTAPFDEKPKRQTAQFWLCGNCAATLTLLLDPVNGLKLVPLGSEPEVQGVPVDRNGLRGANNC